MQSYRIMQLSVHFSVVESKSYIGWFHNTAKMATKMWQTPMCARFFTTPKYSLSLFLSSSELLEQVCGILASHADYLYSTRTRGSSKMNYDWQKLFLYFTLRHHICYWLYWTQAASITVRIVAQSNVLSTRSDVWQRHRRLLFPLCPEIHTFVDVLNCERCI